MCHAFRRAAQKQTFLEGNPRVLLRHVLYTEHRVKYDITILVPLPVCAAQQEKFNLR